MEELMVGCSTVAGEERTLRCRYSVLVEAVPAGRFFCERYGVKIEEEDGEAACFPALTFSASEMDELMERLVRCRVTPAGLADVLCDWKKRK